VLHISGVHEHIKYITSKKKKKKKIRYVEAGAGQFILFDIIIEKNNGSTSSARKGWRG